MDHFCSQPEFVMSRSTDCSPAMVESSVADAGESDTLIDAKASQIRTETNHAPTSSSVNAISQEFDDTNASSTPPSEMPVVYGELSILGYNGYVPHIERSNRRNRSKFLLCKRETANGIKKSRHYIVKQPQATKAIQDKDLHSISYTFSRSQTIIVEYHQDENADMFQIGRSSEEPIDFVVMDTAAANLELIQQQQQSQHFLHHQHLVANSRHSQNNQRQYHHSENNSRANQHIVSANGLVGLSHRHQRQLAKVGDSMMHSYNQPYLVDIDESRSRLQHYLDSVRQQAVLLNYHHSNPSQIRLGDPFRHNSNNNHNPSSGHPSREQQLNNVSHAHSSNQHYVLNQQQPQVISAPLSNHPDNGMTVEGQNHSSGSGRHHSVPKRSHATQSTISRFACRILVDRNPPYTARIYAAGFDSSKNIFLGEKATKWEQDNTIDGLTTNGVLLMHPKHKPCETNNEKSSSSLATAQKEIDSSNSLDGDWMVIDKQECSSTNKTDVVTAGANKLDDSSKSDANYRTSTTVLNCESKTQPNSLWEDSNNNQTTTDNEVGGVWREVSVDGGIYAIRESRSATQKGTRIENESNVLRDGTLIDLCGATLLWRSVDGFKASPTKKSLEEKLDMLNASRPQCPVGLNTLVIPRKPILPNNSSSHHGQQRHHHRNKEDYSSSRDSDDKTGHQPYVYLKCGHVQGYHDWGVTDGSNQRTCPICLSVGSVAKLSMGLEPSFYVDSGPLTHVFNPCGHMASERTIKYWCSLAIPHGTHFFHSVCPFCATPLASGELGFTRLIFQDDLD